MSELREVHGMDLRFLCAGYGVGPGEAPKLRTKRLIEGRLLVLESLFGP